VGLILTKYYAEKFGFPLIYIGLLLSIIMPNCFFINALILREVGMGVGILFYQNYSLVD
jgi:hypothetical protein